MTVESFAKEAAGYLHAEDIVQKSEDLEKYTRNLSGYKRDVPLVVRPRGPDEVQKIVASANTHGVALYPFSQGKNWGLGSKLPVVDGCILVDLRQMNQILDVNTTFGYAVVQPGVTQKQLSDHLRQMGAPFYMDVTGSGQDTSVIGNTTERGVAYNSLRADKLLGLEVVLGNGEVLKTGFGHYPNSKVAALCKYGTGPALDQVFPQSNYGIVVQATVELLPVPEYQSTFLLNIRDEADLAPTVDALRKLTQAGVLESVVHIGNRRRSEVTMTPLMYRYFADKGEPISREEADRLVQAELKGPWSALGNLSGPKSHVKHAQRRLKAAVGKYGQIRFVTAALVDFAIKATGIVGPKSINSFLNASKALLDLPRGLPTNAALHSTYWPVASDSPTPTEPDETDGGMLFAAPIVPQDGASVMEAIRATDAVGDRHGFKMAVTLNMMYDKSLEGVVSIDFDRRDADQCAKAKACMKDLNQTYLDLSFNPYRIDIESMPIIIDPEDTFWQTIRDLKQVFDPNNVISPKRFNLI